MPINVSEAIDSDTGVIVTVERSNPGAYVDGIYVDAGTTTFKTLCSPQQPTPEDLQNLKEGERTKNIKKFFCVKVVRTASEDGTTLADVILFKGKQFKVISAEDWDTFGHTIVLGAQIK